MDLAQLTGGVELTVVVYVLEGAIDGGAGLAAVGGGVGGVSGKAGKERLCHMRDEDAFVREDASTNEEKMLWNNGGFVSYRILYLR